MVPALTIGISPNTHEQTSADYSIHHFWHTRLPRVCDRKGKFPSNPPTYSLHHISHFIELSQLAPVGNEVWFHVDPVSTGSPSVNETVNELIKEIRLGTSSVKMTEAPRDSPLPPASLQSFLKHDKNIAGVVIADHSTTYTNKYYNSFHDNAESLGIVNGSEELSKRLADVVAAVSKALYKMFTEEELSHDIRNETLIEDLLYCYLVNASCNLTQEIDDPSSSYQFYGRIKDFVMYVGVEVPHHNSVVAVYTQKMLIYLSGEHMESRDQKNCSGNGESLYNYHWMAGSNLSGICVKSAAQKTPALSPAFLLEDWESTEYSTWTESVWEEISLVIFLQPSILKQAITLLVGCIITVISLVIVYFVNKRASVLFGARNLTGC